MHTVASRGCKWLQNGVRFAQAKLGMDISIIGRVKGFGYTSAFSPD